MVPPPTPSFCVATRPTARLASRPAKPASGRHTPLTHDGRRTPLEHLVGERSGRGR